MLIAKKLYGIMRMGNQLRLCDFKNNFLLNGKYVYSEGMVNYFL